MRRSIKKGHKANIVGKKVKFNDEKSSESVDDVEERSQRNSQSTKTFKKLDDDEGIDKEFDEDFELDEFEQVIFTFWFSDLWFYSDDEIGGLQTPPPQIIKKYHFLELIFSQNSQFILKG